MTRNGHDFSGRFPFIALAVAALPARSCLIDGEAIVCDDNGLAVFNLVRQRGTHANAVHCAFDLLELDGEDLRRLPIEKRKQALSKLQRGAHSSLTVNEHFEGGLSIRHYARLVGDWIRGIGLDPCLFGTHSLRRTKATLIYRRTGNLRAVQLLLGHTKIESTVRYLGIEVDDALAIAEQIDL